MERRFRCNICCQLFSKSKGLRRHIYRRKKILECEYCKKVFCNIDNLQKHIRSHVQTSKNINTDSVISTETGFENESAYRDIIQQNISKISTKNSNFKRYQVYNIEIDSRFTYKELYNILVEIYSFQNESYKLNLGFGFILKNVVTSEYRYYYNGINNLIFENAYTISSRKDIESFFEKLSSIDLMTTYYLKKPSSS